MAALPTPSPSPASPPVPGAGTAPGQPPFGSSPVSMPTPNRGFQANAMSLVSLAIKLLEKSLPMLGASSTEGKEVMRALTNLSKHIPPGSVTPGIEHTAMQNFMTEQRQAAPKQALLNAIAAKSAGAPPAAAA